MLKRMHQKIDHLSKLTVWIGGAAMLFTAFLVGFEVLIRKLFNLSIGGADEISGYIFAAATAWSYAAVLRHKGNVRIDVVYNLLPGPAKLILDLVSFTAIGALFALIGWYGFELVASTIQTGRISVTPLRTPLAIPQVVWIAGIGLALLMWVLIAARVIASMCQRNWAEVSDLIGNDGMEGEIETELGVDSNSIDGGVGK